MAWSISAIGESAGIGAAVQVSRNDQARPIRSSASAYQQAGAPAPLPADTTTQTAATAVSTEISAMVQGQRASNQAVSVLQTADGGLQNIETLLHRMRDLASEASDSTMTPARRSDLDAQYQTLAAQMRDVVDSTRYNGAPLLDGTHPDVIAPVRPGLSDGGTRIRLPLVGGVRQFADGTRLESAWATSKALADIDSLIADVGQMRHHLRGSSFALQAATIRTLDQQVDLAGADAMMVDSAYNIATNALVSVRVQQRAAHLVAVVANQMPTAAMALLYFNGAASGGR